jgi:hypothetical protein
MRNLPLFAAMLLWALLLGWAVPRSLGIEAANEDRARDAHIAAQK